MDVDSTLIRKGYWINHDYGYILGATITTDQRISSVIVAFLAIMVSVATTSAWHIVIFVLHQSRATSAPKDGLFRQQQVLLRTLATPSSFFLDCIKMFKVWSLENTHATMRCLLPALFALGFAVASLTAGLFSSYIVSTENLQVLVDSPSCLDMNVTAYFTTETMAFDTSLFAAAEALSDQCYGSGPLPSRCNFYVHPRIQFSASEVDCPFNSSVCVRPDNAIVLDSGLLDSNNVFGINGPKHDRVHFRRQVTCAPLNVIDHIEIFSAHQASIESALGRDALQNEQVWMLEYGPQPQLNSISIPGRENVTAIHSTFNSNATLYYSTGGSSAYSSADVLQYNIFEPISTLQRNDSDVALMFIYNNHVTSWSEINDPVYSAHQKGTKNTANEVQKNVSSYVADLPVGVLGFTPQYQFCVETESDILECTPLQGAMASGFENVLPSANAHQLGILELLGKGTVLVNLLFDPTYTSPPFLNSSAQVIGGFVNGLPDDQWKLDAQKMENFVLAYLQNYVALHAVGYTTGTGGAADIFELPDSQDTLCSSQKVVKSGGFANISVFGLAFTCAISGLLVILDFGVLRMLILRGDTKKQVSPRLLFWFEDGVYQMQRAAYEACSNTLWGKTDNEIPVTAHTERLTNLASYTRTHAATPACYSDAPLSSASFKNASVASIDTRTLNTASSALVEVPIPPPWPSLHDGSSATLTSPDSIPASKFWPQS